MIVIPMAGLSRRFTAAGYTQPKYMLPLGGRSVFSWAVGSFERYFKKLPFLFIARDVQDTGAFVAEACTRLGIGDYHIELLDEMTAGQAETVEFGIRRAGVGADTALTIFNIDTFRPGFSFPASPWMPVADGYLEVFRGSGPNWSYVLPTEGSNDLVAQTAEKREISNLCCTGLYHFRKAEDFLFAIQKERDLPTAAELYVAPVYNHLVNVQKKIHYEIVSFSSLSLCGVPQEYEFLLSKAGI